MEDVFVVDDLMSDFGSSRENMVGDLASPNKGFFFEEGQAQGDLSLRHSDKTT